MFVELNSGLICRNTSDKRKLEIMKDLQLPLNHPAKFLKAVVATVSLGVGVDIRVKNVVSFGLGSSPEDTVQEAGRCMRGHPTETEGMRGLAFFFQKGTIAALYCNPSSDCRSLITDPLPKCQTATLYKFFDPEFENSLSSCSCCYSCIMRDSNLGCKTCSVFLETYLPKKKKKFTGSVLRKLKMGLLELFRGLDVKFIEVESKLQLTVENFTFDYIRAFDEIKCSNDIVEMWHIRESLAMNVYSVSIEILEDRDSDELEFVLSDDETENSSSTDNSEVYEVDESEELSSDNSDL